MSENVVVDLIRALVGNMRGAVDGWESLSFVLEVANGEVRGTYGYLYSPDAVTAVSTRPSQIEAEARAYLASHFEPGDALPVKLLVQFDRTQGKYTITFEDTDTSRWAVTPANIDTIREELRPRLAS